MSVPSSPQQFYPTPGDTPTHGSTVRCQPIAIPNTPTFPRRHGFGIGIVRNNVPIYRRRRKILRDNLAGAINKPTIRRLARRGGIKRIQGDIYPTVREVVRDYLKRIIHKLVLLVEHARRKTVTTLDVVYALRALGSPIYGFGSIYYGNDIPNHRAEYLKKMKKMEQHRQDVARRAADQEARDARLDNLQRGMQRGVRA
ncbi:hypothetical protein LTS08_003236 [Lithohypha guttulata]|nr:hypothetical protein LTS08_003236 [Lithohypha guttulata]